jgi:hypothetical protein
MKRYALPKAIIELRDMLLYTVSRKLDIEQAKVGPDVRTRRPNNIAIYINRDDQPVFIGHTIRKLSLPWLGVEFVIDNYCKKTDGCYPWDDHAHAFIGFHFTYL